MRTRLSSVGLFFRFIFSGSLLFARPQVGDASDITTVQTSDSLSSIAGLVTGPDGTMPLPNVQAIVFRHEGASFFSAGAASTDSGGGYCVAGLPAGTYRILFVDGSDEYLSEAFDNVPDVDSGQDIVLFEGATVTGIDASLAAASRISGKVTGPDGKTPLPNILAEAYRHAGSMWSFVKVGTTDADGNYSIGGLPIGTYRVKFCDYEDVYSLEVYDNVTDLDFGRDIVLSDGMTVTGIDASLATASSISGKVTGPDGMTPLPNIQAEAYRHTGSMWRSVKSIDTDASGNYNIGGLPVGTYRVRFTSWSQLYEWNADYRAEVFDNIPDLGSGQDIILDEGVSATGIDASLAYASRISEVLRGRLDCRLESGYYFLWVNAETQTLYQLEQSTDLLSWSQQARPFQGAAGMSFVFRDTKTDNRSFFRLRSKSNPIDTDGFLNLSDGTKMYRRIGGCGPLLVFVHGGTQTSGDWLAQMANFSTSNRVAIYDLRGFGRSESGTYEDSPWSWSWSQTNRATDDLAELIDSMTNGPVNICGLSMGSAIAAQYALQYSNRISKLVLASPWEGYTFPKDSQLQSLNAMSNRTLVLIGSEDTWGSQQEIQWAKSQGYSAPVITVDGADHTINISKPDDFSSLVRNFLVGQR